MAYITLSKNHFFHNLDIIANKTKSKDKIALVLKDNAYGHGLLHIASLANSYGITKAVVRTEEEAHSIYGYFPYILVLASIPKEANDKIHYTINDIHDIQKFPEGSKVELKVDTGMNRNGIEMEELFEAFRLLHKHKLELKAVFTHYSGADELDGSFQRQREYFQRVKEQVGQLIQGYNMAEVVFHSANSAALFRLEDFDESMARVGIAAYGCLALPKQLPQPKLLPVLRVYAKRLSSRVVHTNECVGYGGIFQAKKSCIISNYDFGYADGFLRICSNRYSTPEGVEIVGRISMDNSSFLSEREELLIFDNAIEAAKFAKTISYEILTALKPSLIRKVIE